MLQGNLELIVQYPVTRGYMCRGFLGLRLAASAYVVFDGADTADQSVASSLGQGFCQEVLRYLGAREQTPMPCSGMLGAVFCHAMGEPTCRKILVRPAATGSMLAANTWPPPSAERV